MQRPVTDCIEKVQGGGGKGGGAQHDHCEAMVRAWRCPMQPRSGFSKFGTQTITLLEMQILSPTSDPLNGSSGMGTALQGLQVILMHIHICKPMVHSRERKKGRHSS